MLRLLISILILSTAMTSVVFARCQIVWLDPAATPAEFQPADRTAEPAGKHDCWSLDCHPHDPDGPRHTHLPEDDASRKASRIQSGTLDVVPMLMFAAPCLWTASLADAGPSFTTPAATAIPPREPPHSGRISHLLF